MNVSYLQEKKALWIVSALIVVMVVSGLASSRVRLIYYRQKDSGVTWIAESLYKLNRRNAAHEVRIVCMGDSMTDDMPEQPLINRLLIRRPTWTEMLQSKLWKEYPNLRIFVYNHGLRSNKIATALARMEKSYEREDYYYERFVSTPSVREMKPDIIILESHGYMDHDTDYEEYVKTVKGITHLATEEMGAQIYFLITICPDSENLKKPYEFYANNREKRKREAQLIRERLEDCIQLGQELGVPIIDVYHRTTSYPESFIKKQDMVHPSFKGHMLIAEVVFENIKTSKVFHPEKDGSTKDRELLTKWEY